VSGLLPAPGSDAAKAQGAFPVKVDDQDLYYPLLRPVRKLDWLVEGLIPAGPCVGLMVGTTGSGKTFVAIELARCLDRGVPFFGKAVKRGASLMNASESAYGIPQRYQAAFEEDSQQPGFDPRTVGCLYYFKPPPDLRDEKARKAYVDFVKALAADAEKRSGNPLRMVILDTFSASFVVENENSNSEVAAVINLCNAIAQELQCAVAVVHHFGKNEAKGARGSSAFRANVDFQLDIFPGRVHVTKTKEGPIGYDLGHFKLQPVHMLGEDGELVQSVRIVQPRQSIATWWTPARAANPAGYLSKHTPRSVHRSASPMNSFGSSFTKFARAITTPPERRIGARPSTPRWKPAFVFSPTAISCSHAHKQKPRPLSGGV
jgi:hypothetical protein